MMASASWREVKRNVAISGGTLTGTGNAYSITVTDSTVAATALNTLEGKTTEVVNAAGVGALTGTYTNVLAAYNNAGIAGNNARTWELDVADWRRVALSVLGAVALNQTLATNHRAGRYMAM